MQKYLRDALSAEQIIIAMAKALKGLPDLHDSVARLERYEQAEISGEKVRDYDIEAIERARTYKRFIERKTSAIAATALAAYGFSGVLATRAQAATALPDLMPPGAAYIFGSLILLGVLGALVLSNREFIARNEEVRRDLEARETELQCRRR
jgi:hypothetical protein